MSISANLSRTQAGIRLAASRCGREPSSVRLVAVSKTHPPESVLEAFRAGQSVFGENYVQEFIEKAAKVREDLSWHFIGHLQSNKVKHIAGVADMVHSVDRMSLAEEISRQWGRVGKSADILVQVNISGESTKSGTDLENAAGLVTKIAMLPNVRIRGLMTMPPFFDEPEKARPFFRSLKILADKIAGMDIQGVEMKELSMGMSGDYEVAIEEGATLVRIGTSIFGERDYQHR